VGHAGGKRKEKKTSGGRDILWSMKKNLKLGKKKKKKVCREGKKVLTLSTGSGHGGKGEIRTKGGNRGAKGRREVERVWTGDSKNR